MRLVCVVFCVNDEWHCDDLMHVVALGRSSDRVVVKASLPVPYAVSIVSHNAYAYRYNGLNGFLSDSLGLISELRLCDLEGNNELHGVLPGVKRLRTCMPRTCKLPNRITQRLSEI